MEGRKGKENRRGREGKEEIEKREGTRGCFSAKIMAIIVKYQLLLVHHMSIATKTSLFSKQQKKLDSGVSHYNRTVIDNSNKDEFSM